MRFASPRRANAPGPASVRTSEGVALPTRRSARRCGRGGTPAHRRCHCHGGVCGACRSIALMRSMLRAGALVRLPKSPAGSLARCMRSPSNRQVRAGRGGYCGPMPTRSVGIMFAVGSPRFRLAVHEGIATVGPEVCQSLARPCALRCRLALRRPPPSAVGASTCREQWHGCRKGRRHARPLSTKVEVRAHERAWMFAEELAIITPNHRYKRLTSTPWRPKWSTTCIAGSASRRGSRCGAPTSGRTSAAAPSCRDGRSSRTRWSTAIWWNRRGADAGGRRRRLRQADGAVKWKSAASGIRATSRRRSPKVARRGSSRDDHGRGRPRPQRQGWQRQTGSIRAAARCSGPTPTGSASSPSRQAVDAGQGRVLITGAYGAGSAMIRVEKKADGTYAVAELFKNPDFGAHTPSGYRVMVVPTDGRRATGYEPLVDGFLPGMKIRQRPGRVCRGQGGRRPASRRAGAA